MDFHYTQLYNTYSIIAQDASTGHLGGAVQTHQMAVGRIIPFALPGVGVIASQSLSNVSFGPIALSMLKEGVSPQQIIAGLVASDPNARRRQVGIINARGEGAAFTGEGCIREFGHYVGEGYSVHANMMTRPTVIAAMREAFERTAGDLAARMMATLQAAQAEEGDIRGMQSAALKVVPGKRTAPEWETIYDLRVDEHHNPVTELARLVTIRQAQLIDSEGHQLLNKGQLDAALHKWQQARELAPEQEEVAFWQAIALADAKPSADAVATAAQIITDSLLGHQRWNHWLDLIARLEACGLLSRAGCAQELFSAIQERTT